MSILIILNLGVDPGVVASQSGVHTRVSRVGTAISPRDDTDLIVDIRGRSLQHERTARVALARVLASVSSANHRRSNETSSVRRCTFRVGSHSDCHLTEIFGQCATTRRCSSPSNPFYIVLVN